MRAALERRRALATERVERRLTAILAADVAGYSRLTGLDEEGTHARLQDHLRLLVDPKIAEHRGRVVKNTGDGLLAEFSSVVDAVRCAVDVQRGMAERNADVPPEKRVEFRIGINVGDVMIERGDIFGDGVNVAARLEGLAEPGGICISEDAHRQVQGKMSAEFIDIGEQQLKNIGRPVRVYRVHLGGAPRPHPALAPSDKPSKIIGSRRQEITYCRTKDGVNLAVACIGQGMSLVRAAHWITHVEYEWQNPLRVPLLHFLADHFHLIRYDSRGTGLSDWDVADVSFEALEQDLETVVDALGLRSYALLGISQGAALSIVHAIRYPRRVSKMVLLGGFAVGQNMLKRFDMKAFLTLMREGWGDEHSAFQKMLSTASLPNASAEQIKWLADLQRMASSGENAVRLRSTWDAIDITDVLPKVSTPTLVMHCRHDNVVPFEEGRRLAKLIPNAKFVPLESENHLPQSFEPAWSKFIGEIEAFLSH
jgi:class 3 adenylate cyclase/pimeloyl-ACP methyl ester carboxylesterase